jgi:alanine dehydrogenase
MIIGVPKEIKKLEYRVGLTPAAAKAYLQAGHQVLIQQDAGLGSGFSNQEYSQVGCKVVPTMADVYGKSEMIIKVKEPLAEEFDLLRPNQILYTFLHLAAAKPLTMALLKNKVTAIAYETIKDKNGRLPVLRPMSEVAGRLAVQEGAKYLQKLFGGRGVLLGGIPGVEPGHVVVLGANGYAGFNATQIALGMQAKVTAIDLSFSQVETLLPFANGRLTMLASNETNIATAIKQADLVISTVLIPGDAAPKLIKKHHLAMMPKGSVIVDVAIDQGGSTETSKVTYHDQPIYEVDGVIHYCVANMPGAVPRTSTIGLNQATLPYGLAIANLGFKQAMKNDAGLANGLNTYQGQLTFPALAQIFQLPLLKISDVLSSR